MNIIETINLTRDFEYFEKEEGLKGSLKTLLKKEKKYKRALDNFTFSMKKGESIGLIGPNGAGKTTLIKMMTGIIRPTEGSVIVDGYVPSDLKQSFKRKYAVVMGQKSQLWWDLPAIDTFTLNKALYEIPTDVFEDKLATLVNLFDVSDLLNKQVRKLSLGQRMKMEIIASLLHGPEILFLDEPTIGLDMIAQKQMRRFLKKLNEETGISIILTSHYMEDIKHLCDRVIVINDGKKIFDDQYEILKNYNGNNKLITITFDDLIHFDDETYGKIVDTKPYKVTMNVEKKHMKKFLMSLFDQYDIDDISIEEEDISAIVEKIYRKGQVIS